MINTKILIHEYEYIHYLLHNEFLKATTAEQKLALSNLLENVIPQEIKFIKENSSDEDDNGN